MSNKNTSLMTFVSASPGIRLVAFASESTMGCGYEIGIRTDGCRIRWLDTSQGTFNVEPLNPGAKEALQAYRLTFGAVTLPGF